MNGSSAAAGGTTDGMVTLASRDGMLQALINPEGGMLASLSFKPGTGQSHAILHRAPWLDDPLCAGLTPPLMSRLGGEWVGVPFGHTARDGDGFYRDAPHGLPANRRWQVDNQREEGVQLSFTFPNEYPIARLQRTIALNQAGTVVFSLTLLARRECRFPIGLHPIFPVGGDAGAVELEALDLTHGIVYPAMTEPGISRLAPLADFTQLSSIPTRDGAKADLSHLPLPYATEEIVQLLSPVSGIVLRYPARNVKTTLLWDTQRLPYCLLWFSNGGRTMPPWEGKNFCLGVEPICSAWDLGPECNQANPLSDRGLQTSLALHEGIPVTINYQLRCQTLE